MIYNYALMHCLYLQYLAIIAEVGIAVLSIMEK